MLNKAATVFCTIFTVLSNMFSLSAGNCWQWEWRPVAQTCLRSQHTGMQSWLTRNKDINYSTCNCLWIVCAWSFNTIASSVSTAPTTCLSSGLSCLRFPGSRSTLVLFAPAPICAAPPPPAMIQFSKWLQVWLYASLATNHQETQWSSFLLYNLSWWDVGVGLVAALCYHWPTDILSSAVPVITLLPASVIFTMPVFISTSWQPRLTCIHGGNIKI